MDDSFNTADESDDDDQDPDERALDEAKRRYEERSPRAAESLRSGMASTTFSASYGSLTSDIVLSLAAKQFIDQLDALPSISRYVFYRAHSSDAGLTSAERRDRATSAIVQLSLIFRRLHWKAVQERRFTSQCVSIILKPSGNYTELDTPDPTAF